MLSAIRAIQPTYVVAENVSGIINWNGGLVFNEVQTDLEAAGYEVTPFVLPAAGVNAPHRRDRVWFIADSHNARTNNASRLDGNGSAKNEGRVKQSLVEYRQDGRNGITTNATGSSSKGKLQQGQKQRELGGCNSEITANTDKQGLERSEVNGGTSGSGSDGDKQSARHVSSNWENFPTQSPICGGNDGISDRLVGITFPKWRNESIASLGNAIVPAVALQIFKAIQDVHLQLKK